MPLPKHFSGMEVNIPKVDWSDTKDYINNLGNKKNISVSKNYAWLIGAAVGTLVLGAFYFLSSPELKNAFMNLFVLAALILGFLYGAVKSKFSLKGAVLGAIIFAVIVGTTLFFMPTILNASSPYVPQVKGLADKAQFLLNPSTLLSQGPLAILFPNTQSEAPADRTITATFTNPKSTAPLEVEANVGVKTRDSIILAFTCLLDGKTIQANPSTIQVEKKDIEQFFSVICSNPEGGKTLSLKVSAPFQVEAILPVSTGSGDSKGKVSSTMTYDSPFALSLELPESQPIAKRSAAYPLTIKFFRKESGTVLKSIESLDINSQSRFYTLICKYPLDSMPLSASRDKLDILAIDKSKDTYAFPCSLDVSSTPSEGAEQSFINAKASFTIEKEFKTALISEAKVA